MGLLYAILKLNKNVHVEDTVTGSRASTEFVTVVALRDRTTLLALKLPPMGVHR